MPKRGGRGRGRGGKPPGRGGHGGGGRGGGRQGYNVDYYGDQFEDDYMSFTGQHSRRSNAEEEVYRRIQMAKANNRNRNGSNNNNFNNNNNFSNNSRGGHHDRQSGFRPPPPKQGNNGKNSKHHFWPHPESQTHSTIGQRAKAKINANNPVQISFNRATSLTDPTAYRQLSQEYDLEQDDYDESEDEDSSDDLIHRGIDCSEDESDCELMQQFDWIEEEQDQDTPTALDGHVVETSATVIALSGPSYNDMESEIVSASLDSSLGMGMAMTQSDDVRDIIETVRNIEIGADEISHPSSVATTTTTTTTQSSTTVEIEDDGKTTIVKPDTVATTGHPQLAEQDKPKKKKAHRSKRGGKNQSQNQSQREKQIARQMVVGNDDDGPMFLEDGSSDEDEDEEILAMEDYLQNTMDAGDPKKFETLLGALKGLHAGHGHSKNLRGKNADYFDFEQPGSEDDSQDNDDDDDEDEDEFDFEEDYRDGGAKKLDFRKVSDRARDTRKNRKVDDLLREALEEEEENLLPLWRAGAIGDGDGSNRRFKGRAKGYVVYDSDEEFKRGGANSPGSKKKKNKSNFNKNNQMDGDFLSLLDINRSIEYFVKDRTTDTLQLQPMPKDLRRRVHLLCNHYNLKSQSIGSGKRRFPVLIKTERTKMPVNPANVNKLLSQGDNELARLSAQFQGSRKGNGGNGGQGHGYGGGKKGKGRGGFNAAIVHGAVVGAEASEISVENLGHRMLSKMGWSPGVGLGASGEGITQPIEAIMRSNRRGLGHE
ncbi:hypothetical protein BGZ74_008981 [Mortierella antarctica]|nr:hypothetical protein BGZ74_008981 [Mortierella antarctica]